MNAVGIFLHTPSGRDIGRLFTGHIAYQGRSGWRVSLEQEPMKWGFGPLGGHLLGTSFQPFPKLRITTPVYAPSLWGCPLGRWQVDWFTGRLESDRPIPKWQHSYWTLLEAASPSGRDVSRPFQSGFRISAKFLEHIEMNFGVTSMWGGIGPDGRDRMKGDHWYDYGLASLGAENLIVESSGDPTKEADLSHYHNYSNGIASFEIRSRSSSLARWFGAQGAYWYYERDGENVNWQWKDFLRNPLKAAVHDLHHLTLSSRYDQWKSVPNLSAPTHALGFQIHWPRWQLGAEYRRNDTRMDSPSSYQTYENSGYPSGHSRLGDCMGFMLGGNYRVGILSLDCQPSSTLNVRTVVATGARRFMDTLSLWQAAHPGNVDPDSSHVLLAELGVQLSLPAAWRLGFGLGLKHEELPDFGPGTTSGYNLTLTFVKRFSH